MMSLVMTQQTNVSSSKFSKEQQYHHADNNYSSTVYNSKTIIPTNNVSILSNNYSTSSVQQQQSSSTIKTPSSPLTDIQQHHHIDIVNTNGISNQNIVPNGVDTSPFTSSDSNCSPTVASKSEELPPQETCVSSVSVDEPSTISLVDSTMKCNDKSERLSFCQMLQEHNYSTRMSMKMLMILDLANKLVVLVNSKNLVQLKEFIKIDVKEHGIALYGHIGGGQKFIREVINYIGSKRTKRKFMPLTTACIIGCLRMVKVLMKSGANQYQKCLDELPVETAQRCGHKDIVRFLRDFSLDTCHKNRKIRKHFKHSLNDQYGLMLNSLHDVAFTFTN